MCDIVVRGTAATALPQLAQEVASRMAARMSESAVNRKTYDS